MSSATIVQPAADKPTDFTYDALYTWVIWHVPHKGGDGLFGAVRPSTPHHHWYPALVYPKERRVTVLAHHNKLFATPETAVDAAIKQYRAVTKK